MFFCVRAYFTKFPDLKATVTPLSTVISDPLYDGFSICCGTSYTWHIVHRAVMRSKYEYWNFPSWCQLFQFAMCSGLNFVLTQIWSALDLRHYLLATRLYLLARHIYNTVQLDPEAAVIVGHCPLLARQWASVCHFKMIILQVRCWPLSAGWIFYIHINSNVM